MGEYRRVMPVEDVFLVLFSNKDLQVSLNMLRVDIQTNKMQFVDM